MKLGVHHWVALAALIELVLLLILWGFLRRQRNSLRKLGRLANQLADGTRPASYYIDGPNLVAQVAQKLESIGNRLETLQKRSEEEDFNLNVLLANMVEGVMVVDRRHAIQLVNEPLLKLFDLKTSPLGRTVLEALREARVELLIRETIAKDEVKAREVVLQGASGEPSRHLEVSAVPIHSKDEEIDGAVLVFHDITKIKHLEVVRSEFVANVSHELRTPLAIFRGYLETLMDQPKLPAAQSKQILMAMGRHSERLTGLVEDLLMLTRFEAKRIEMKLSSVRVDAFFRQLVQDWRQQPALAETEIDLQIDENLPPLEVDPLRFGQVFLNLLENAVAYSNPPRHIVLSAAQQGKMIEFRVADNGIGIPPADLPHIFERFYRVDKGRSRASGGTGLGLSIVKNMTQAHQGTVHVESEFGKGTTMVLRFPISRETDGDA